MAEDARIITVKKIDEERLTNERLAGADREARAESARLAAQADAARVARDAETAQIAAQTEADRVKQENIAKMDAAQNAATWQSVTRSADGCCPDRSRSSETRERR